MGFRTGAYARVWEKDVKEKYTSIRLSVSKKDKQTGEYVQEFNGIVRCIGNAHQQMQNIVPPQNIRIGDCDVTTYYDKEKEKGYTNFFIFSLTDANDTAPKKDLGDFEFIPNQEEDDLPF